VSQSELVSVVVPAYNAQATLARTLASVRAQTYANLEIVVVDDGSTDATRQLAEAEAREDSRIRVLSQANAGVAAARNAGIRAGRGALLAPVDADDLWHPEKIAKQVAVMETGGPRMGFVYTYFRRISPMGNAVTEAAFPLVFSGPVFLRHLLFNFVGNGSSILMRREAFESAGGYEPELQRRGAQGCEDYLLQLLIARSWTVGVVPEYLTGYRLASGAMSDDQDRMNRSLLLMLERVRARFPEVPRDILAVAEASLRSRRAMGTVFHLRRPVAGAIQYLKALGCEPAAASAMAGYLSRHSIANFVRRQLRRPQAWGGPRTPFLEMNPAVGVAPVRRHPLHKWLIAYAEREEAFFHAAPAPSVPTFPQRPSSPLGHETCLASVAPRQTGERR
jgi:hypothetical protein